MQTIENGLARTELWFYTQVGHLLNNHGADRQNSIGIETNLHRTIRYGLANLSYLWIFCQSTILFANVQLNDKRRHHGTNNLPPASHARARMTCAIERFVTPTTMFIFFVPRWRSSIATLFTSARPSGRPKNTSSTVAARVSRRRQQLSPTTFRETAR